MIIIANKSGRLGNRLFLYATFIAFCSKNKLTVCNPAFDEYCSYFEGTKDHLISCYPQKNRSWIISAFLRKLFFKIIYRIANWILNSGIKNKLVTCVSLNDSEEMDLEDKNSITLFKSRFSFAQGWLFRAPVLLKSHRAEIVKLFTPIKKHRENIDSLLKKIRSSADIVIGVHIRHGDYRKFEKGKYFYSLVTYSEIITHTLSLFPGKKVSFLICSNEKHDFSIFKRVSITQGTNHFIEDMYSFAKCDYLIGPPSTFTMWASYYGNVPLYIMNTALNYPKSTEEFKPIS